MKFLKFHLGLMLALSLFMSTVVPSNVYAVSTKEFKMTSVKAASSIEEVFQKFQYAISVEWDQQDVAFKQQAEKELVKGLLALQESGISLEEIQAFMQRTLLSKAAQAEYLRMMEAMRGQNLSQDEITAKTMEFLTKTQSHGVNFNGEGGPVGGRGMWSTVVIVILVVVVTHLILRGSHNRNDDHDHDDDDGDIIIINN